MRNYIPTWEKLGISKERYIELLRFCHQYDEWKHAANSMLGVRGVAMDGQPHGTGVGDPVFAAVVKRTALMAKIDIVERCALSVDGGIWFNALIEHICRKKPHAAIDQAIMPTSNRAAFYQAKKKFFVLLNELRDENLTLTLTAVRTTEV